MFELQTHLEIFARASGDQLFGDVVAFAQVAFRVFVDHVRVRFPRPVSRVRVRSGRRRVRHSGRGHDPRGFARGHRPLGYGLRPVLRGQRPPTVVPFHRGRQPDRLEIGFHARQVSGGRARRIGHLFVHAIRLKRNRVDEKFPYASSSFRGRGFFFF